MSKRVYQIARELDVENSTLLPELQAMGYDVTSAASSVTDEEAAVIIAAFKGVGGDDERSDNAQADDAADEIQADDPGDDGDDGVSVSVLDPTGEHEGDEPDEPEDDQPDAAVGAADAAKQRRGALQQRIQALFDDPGADVEAGLVSLLEGTAPPAGRRWRLVRRGSVTAGPVKCLKGETISDQEYQMLTGRVKAFFDPDIPIDPDTSGGTRERPSGQAVVERVE